MQEPLRERPAAPRDESTATARQHQDSFVDGRQSLTGAFNNGSIQPFNGSFDGQSVVTNGSYNEVNNAVNVNNANNASNASNANNAHYGDGGAFPVSASSHASLPATATLYNYAYNTLHAADPTTSNAPQPAINRSSNASPSITSGLGPLVTSSAFNAPSPSPSSQNPFKPVGIIRNTPPLTVERPSSTHYDLPTTTELPSPITGGRESLPSQRQQFESSTGVSSPGAAAQWTATNQATAQPVASTSPAVDKESDSTSNRQNAASGDVPAPKPAQAPASAIKPTEGGGGTGMNKPVLKMRRTGQNSPLSPVGASSPFRTPASLHQRNGSNSPGGRSTPGLPTASIRKAAEIVSSKAAGAPLPDNDAISPASKSLDAKAGPVDPNKALTTNPNKRKQSSADWEARSPKNHNGPDNMVSFAIGGSDASSGSGQSSQTVENPGVHSTAVPDTEDEQDSDDEIKYETAVKTTGLDDAFDLNGVAVEADTSSDGTDSASEDDAPAELRISSLNGDTNSSFRQLFLPPEGSDYEEDDDSEDDDASSISSSTKSSLAAEPTAALPSANIQHQVDYPSNILEMATPDRAYVTWSDGITYIPKSGGALFPEGYQKCTEILGHPWLCPVRSCRQVYKTHRGLLNHFKFTHKKAMFNDNMDGTLTLVGSYTQKNELGSSPPVVVSRRPADPTEPPMLEPSIPVKKQEMKGVSTSIKTGLLPSSRGEESVVQAHLDLVSSDLPVIKVPGSSEKMWEYVLPFLTVHKSIPVMNWVPQVIRLPRVRDIKWNEERNKEHPYRDSHPRDVAALIVQVTGVEAPKPCSLCASGRGPFKGCILVSPGVSDEIKASILACANCYYHCGQTKCSHKNENETLHRMERGARDAHQMRNYNIKLLTDKASGRASAERTAQQQASSSENPNSALKIVTSPRHPMKVLEPSEINNIEMASEVRTYKVIHGKDGEMIQMHGALIPEKYDLDRSIPGYPWICPVRQCRLVHKRIINLGSHFGAKHRGCLYNDNLDGTLSQVGAYNKPIAGHTCPALIVSKNPLDKTEPPIEKARIPHGAKALKIVQPSKPASLAVVQPKERVDISNALHGEARKLWEYMLPYLPQSLVTVTDPLLFKVFELPRVRSIKWRKTWHRRSLIDDWRQVAGLLVHLVGAEHDGLVKCCTFCRRGEGPFEGCQVLPPQASYESHKMLRCCANCMFIHRRDHCSIKFSWEKRCMSQTNETSSPAPPIAEWAADLGTSSSSNNTNILGNNRNNKRLHDELSDDGMEETNALRRRSERCKDRNLETEAKSEHTRKLVTLPLPAKEKRTASTGALRAKPDTTELPSSALMCAGLPSSEGFLEMEEWEIAPGRIREIDMSQPNNIAFSKSYLETNQMVQISPELSFRVETIRSGRMLEFDAEQSKMRYCSLASGKLRVSVEGQPDFTIGMHGVFMIKPGIKARVQNRLYVDSVLHINAVESGG